MSGPPLWAAQAQWLRGSPGLVRGHARVPGGSGVAAAVAAAVAARPQPRGRVPSLRRQQVGREPASALAPERAEAGRESGPGPGSRRELCLGRLGFAAVLPRPRARGQLSAGPETGKSFPGPTAQWPG